MQYLDDYMQRYEDENGGSTLTDFRFFLPSFQLDSRLSATYLLFFLLLEFHT